jgi:hypothetical protein
MKYREPCGCVHDGHRIIKWCEPCLAQFTETHQRWAYEHQQQQQQKEQPRG